TITDHFATLASVYNASKYGSTSSANWVGQQEWIYTAQRIVGLVSMRSTATQSAYDVEGILKLVSGRGSWGNVRSFSISTDPDGVTRYTYGNLSVRIIAQNYGGIYTDYVDTMNAGEDTPSGKMGRIRFIDQQALANGGFDPNDTLNTQLDLKPTTYTTATNHYYMVEILPATTAAAASVTADGNPLSTGVRGIDLTENGHAYRLIDNPTSTPKTYTTTINWTGGATVHTAGETYRPDWLGTYSNTDTDFRGRAFGPTTAFDVPAGTFTYTIPAYGHIVLESNAAPTLATPTIAPAPVVGRPSTLSVVGTDDGGASALTYAWSVLGDSTGVSFGNANGTPAGQAISIQFTRPGTYTLQVTATDAGGLSAANTLQVVVPPPPQVTAVTVAGTNWNSSFLSYLTTHHLGTNGYAIPSDPTQASPLPWNNIDTIRLTFDQSVNVGIGDLVLQGVRIPAYAIKSFSYDSTSATASWTLNGPIPADRLHLDLAQSVGNDVNGTLGSDFVFDFNVLPGDVARAPSVLANSLLLVRNAQFATTASTAYSIFYDINANGQILADDLLLVRNAQFNTLPTPV
ncbi:MAG: PKD domain-containing protein, partial [Tepidisphaeraceae bacterium]